MKLGGNITTYTKTASRRQKRFTKIKPRNNVKDLDERYNFNGWNIEKLFLPSRSQTLQQTVNSMDGQTRVIYGS